MGDGLPFICSFHSLEGRNRFSAIRNHNDCGKRKISKPEGVHRAMEKIMNPSHKFNYSMAFILVLIMFLTLLLLIESSKVITIQSPSKYAHKDLEVKHSQKQKRDQEQPTTTTPYPSNLEIQWNHVSSILQILSRSTNLRKIASLNLHADEIKQLDLITNAQISTIHLHPTSSNITWETLYPEWIDEKEHYEVPTCPNLPDPQVSRHSNFDLVILKLPCEMSRKSWSRDVSRLHLQLSVAKVVASGKERKVANVLVLSERFPLLNLFRLKELVTKDGNAWLYKVDVETMRKKVQLPVGSCSLSVPLKLEAHSLYVSTHRHAYVTILHSANKYICGAIVAARSIRMAGSKYDLVVLVDRSISARHRSALASAGWIVKIIDRIRNPNLKRHTYNEFNYSKLRLWQLTDYETVVFLDADILVLHNIDFLFAYPEITASGNDGTLFNSGVMVVEPSKDTFKFMMDHIHEIDSYNGGDQGFLNEVFTWWHRMGKDLNFLKYFGNGTKRDANEASLGGAHVVHYLGMKPWWCYRDYDCNWNMGTNLRMFASDVANEKWWKVHDTMPKELRSFCSLRTKEKAALEWHRIEAEKANYDDGHWRLTIKDARMRVCKEKLCDWGKMLRQWGKDKNDSKISTA